MERRFELTVPHIPGRVRLEDYLLNAFPTVSKMYLRELVRDEKCEVNGRNENRGFRVRSNDLVEIWVDETRGTAMIGEELPLDIVFEDNELIVINKPSGMLVHPSHREKRGTLLNALAHHLNQIGGDHTRPGLIHRLDKETSGLIVVAKTAHSHRALSRHFLKKRVQKSYVALVEGLVAEDAGQITAPIGRFPELKHWSVKDDGKHAESRFVVRERYDDTTMVELEPVTGRTNQLRIHCQSIGHPIVGDTRRGGREAARLYLHAAKLSFPHQSTNQVLSFECEAAFPPLMG
ncbi:MAG: RluA family pseudouridine synthase [Pyrinomonadaceae bacterium]